MHGLRQAGCKPSRKTPSPAGGSTAIPEAGKNDGTRSARGHRARRRARERGITLIEAIVAIAVLSIGSLAGLRALERSAHVLGHQDLRTLALQVARNRAEELKLTGAEAAQGLPSTVDMGPVAWHVAQENIATAVGLVEVTIRVSARDLPGARLVIYVPREAAP